MADVRALEKKIKELEEKVAFLESDKEYMDALYEKAKELVVKHNKASVLFLQKKFMIDFRRAETILSRLKSENL